MKANNLHGDYCQTCATILDEAQRNFRQVVILDSQCASVFQQSGDATRFNTPAVAEDANPAKMEAPAKAEKPEPKKEPVKPAKKDDKR